MVHTFTYRSARSGSFTCAVMLVLAIETAVLHVWLVDRFPVLTWVLTVTTLMTLGWLVADYRAMGSSEICVHPHAIDLPIGRRFTTQIQRTDLLSADVATWRELVDLTVDGLNLTKPAEPNVLLCFRAPTAVPLFGGISRRVRRVGLHVDEPVAFIEALALTPP